MVIGLEDGDGDENVSLMLRYGDTGVSDSDTPLAAARPDSVVTGQEYGEIGWCDRQGRGGMLRPFRNGVERVRGCPVGFLLNGRVVVQRGQELFVGDRRVRTLAPGTFVVRRERASARRLRRGDADRLPGALQPGSVHHR